MIKQFKKSLILKRKILHGKGGVWKALKKCHVFFELFELYLTVLAGIVRSASRSRVSPWAVPRTRDSSMKNVFISVQKCIWDISTFHTILIFNFCVVLIQTTAKSFILTLFAFQLYMFDLKMCLYCLQSTLGYFPGFISIFLSVIFWKLH